MTNVKLIWYVLHAFMQAVEQVDR